MIEKEAWYRCGKRELKSLHPLLPSEVEPYQQIDRSREEAEGEFGFPPDLVSRVVSLGRSLRSFLDRLGAFKPLAKSVPEIDGPLQSLLQRITLFSPLLRSVPQQVEVAIRHKLSYTLRLADLLLELEYLSGVCVEFLEDLIPGLRKTGTVEGVDHIEEELQEIFRESQQLYEVTEELGRRPARE